MSEPSPVEARCLCGAVTLTATRPASEFAACHCEMCRRWGGGPLLAVECGSEVSFEGEDALGIYDSSEWADRGFCRRCGTHLFYRLKDSKEYHVPLGLFADAISPRFALQIFVDRKPEAYRFADDTRDLTEAEAIELFGPGGVGAAP